MLSKNEFASHVYLIYMYKQDLALNNLKTKQSYFEGECKYYILSQI